MHIFYQNVLLWRYLWVLWNAIFKVKPPITFTLKQSWRIKRFYFWLTKGFLGLHLITYLIGQKFVGQKCRNFSLVSKILSDEKFCPSKILSNIPIQKSGKNRTKLSKFRLGVENFVRRNILSVENFVRRNFVR